MIKRVVGLPGDRIFEIYRSPSEIGDSSNAEEFIPQKHFFVKGDLLFPGNDSSTWGPIPFENFYALAVMKLPSRKDVPLAPDW